MDGSGAAPVIAGSDLVTGWSHHQGNIWRAPVSAAVSHVFVGGQLMTLARYPNTGWLRMNGGTATTLHDADLGQASGYWTGATAVIRASHWSYDLAEVTGFSNNTLHFPSIGESPGNYTWGYFLQDKLSELDMAGEWYHDAAAGMLYLHAPGNADPNTLQVEASVRANGAVIAWQRQYITIQDLAFRHQNGACVRNDGGNHLQVENCDAAVERAADAGATVAMPPADQFWGDRYALVVDPFGHLWSFAHTLEAHAQEKVPA